MQLIFSHKKLSYTAMERINLPHYFLIICFCRFLCISTANENPILEHPRIILGESFDKLLKLKLVPDVAYMEQYLPHKYHSDLAKLDFVNVSKAMEAVEGTTSKCSEDITQIIYNLKSDWALQMLDSDGKPSSGILQGGLQWIGKYEECASVYSPVDVDNHGNFHGQYCVTSWTLTIPGKGQKLPLTIGLCVPNSCSADEIQNMHINILKIIDKIPFLKKISSLVDFASVTCKETKPRSVDGPAIAYMAVIGIFLLFMLLGSSVTVFSYLKTPHKEQDVEDCSPVSFEDPLTEMERQESFGENRPLGRAYCSNYCTVDDKASLNGCVRNEGLLNRQLTSFTASGLTILKKILLCFCVLTNSQRILNTDVSNDQMLSIHGIRFLSLTWVIMGHSYISAVSMISNPLDVLHELDSFAFQAVLQAPFSVDSFFLLSGFLLTFLFLKEASKRKGKISWIYFYIHRYWRITPAYLMAVGFYIVVFKYIGSGPFWDDHYGDSCRHTWWWYFLYISNFIPVNDMCVGWSWYLANDMQFYIISPLFLYALWRCPKIGLSIISFLMLCSWAITGILSAKYDLIPMFVGVTKATDYSAYQKRMWYSFDLIYDKPYCRIGPYLIGVILGWIIFKINDRKKFMTTWQQIIGWILALFCSLSVVYGLYHADLSTFAGNTYNALCRSSFSIGLAWLIFVCETGHGGFVSKLLSHKIWIPLSRLTYCAYLFHPILVHGYYQILQAPLYFTQLTMVTNFLGLLVMSYGIAFLTSLAFESPLMNLEKLVLRR